MDAKVEDPFRELYDLPLELMDIILLKSYLHWILNSCAEQRNEEIIRSLTSVDVCFHQRISRRRFKRAIWRYLKDFYGKTMKRSAIITSNRHFLLDNILPTDKFISLLLSLNCLTEEQSQFIQRQRTIQDKNAELLYVARAFDETQFSNFVKCLRKFNQKTVARLIENGGVVIKTGLQTLGAKCRPTAAKDTELLHQSIEDLRKRSKPSSHKTVAFIRQMKEKGIEILNSQLNRKTVVVWIWCRSHAAIEHIQMLYESNQLRFFKKIQPFIPWLINIDSIQFKKTIVVCSISINITHRIDLRGDESVYGVTKLRNEIYVLCRSFSDALHAIRVFDDRDEFRLRKVIKADEIQYPFDIRSSEIDDCLYVSDHRGKCVWKISRITDDEYKLTKWLTTDYLPFTLSVSSGGQLLVINDPSSISILRIYGSDAELIRSIQFPREIVRLQHAVETSIGNLIIIHECMVKEKVQEAESKSVMRWVVSEMTSDGQMVVHRFIPSSETRELNKTFYLLLDADDQVFVADSGNDEVILLDSDLRWNRFLVPTEEEEDEETMIYHPWRLCYDEQNRQLIVGGLLTKRLSKVYAYAIVRN